MTIRRGSGACESINRVLSLHRTKIQKTLDEAIFVYPNGLSREWPEPVMLLRVGGMVAT